MEEKRSGIDMIEEVLLKLNSIEQRLGVIEQVVKRTQNSAKVAEIVNRALDTKKLDGFARANQGSSVPDNIPTINKKDIKKEIEEIKENVHSKIKKFKFEPSDASRMKQPSANRSSRSNKNIMVKGKMVTYDGDTQVPLPQISVKIFDEKDNLVKTTKTNRAGHWMSQLAPGKYVALFEGKFNDKTLVPQNKMFEVPQELPDGQLEFEVL